MVSTLSVAIFAPSMLRCVFSFPLCRSGHFPFFRTLAISLLLVSARVWPSEPRNRNSMMIERSLKCLSAPDKRHPIQRIVAFHTFHIMAAYDGATSFPFPSLPFCPSIVSPFSAVPCLLLLDAEPFGVRRSAFGVSAWVYVHSRLSARARIVRPSRQCLIERGSAVNPAQSSFLRYPSPF